LLVGDVLVVQTGGADGRSVVGLNARNGDTKWAQGDDEVQYQSPSVMSLGGRRQIVAVSATKITGMAAETGDALWTHELEEGIRASSANPTFVGDDRFLVVMSGGARVFKVTGSGSDWSLEQLYVSDSIGGSYAQPVYHDGHLYGFKGQVLTCVDASNGERVWRSRPPGGDGLILVGDLLVIFGSQGNVVVADASPEGYSERARVQALGGSSLTWPSFADGRVFVRNLGEMAAVGLSEGIAVARKTAPAVGNHDFGLWITQVEASSSPQDMVDEFSRAQETFPIVEGEYVHFVYRGDAKDVSIHGSMLDTEVPESLAHVEGTDLFYRTYRLEPATRWEYRYQVDFEEWMTDPRNDRSVPAAEGEERLSELVTPGYDVASHYGEPKGDQGRLDGFQLTSEVLGYEKAIQVWLPPGYDSSKTSYPLLIVNDGDAWLEKGLMANTLDNLVGKSLQPVVVAFVEPSQRWWLEAGGTRTEEYVRMLAEELVPMMQERYRLEADPSSRALMGNRFYAFSGIYATLRYPEVFGKAAAMSVYAGLGTFEDLETMVSEGAGPKVVFYVDWNRYDERNVDRDWNLSEDSKSLADLLQGSGYALTGGEVLDSWGWGGWRNRTDRALIALYPLEK
jgi:enterochelin esterase-like enzyme